MIIERIKSVLTLQGRIPEYQRRAEAFRRLAILESLTSGVLIREEQGVDLVEASQTSIVKVGDKELEFAINHDGICFARIKGNKYYPLDTNLATRHLKESGDYDKLVKNPLRRIIHEPFEGIFGRLFAIQEDIGRQSASLTSLAYQLEHMVSSNTKLSRNC